MSVQNTMATLLLGALALGFTSCNSAPNARTFEVRAIDEYEQPVKCIVVVGDSWPGSEAEAVVTDSSVPVTFRPGESVRLQVKALPETYGDETETRIPGRSEPVQFLTEFRDLGARDPRVQLFILRRNPEYVAAPPRGR